MRFGKRLVASARRRLQEHRCQCAQCRADRAYLKAVGTEE